jgi:hypothetical protein
MKAGFAMRSLQEGNGFVKDFEALFFEDETRHCLSLAV